jgi:ABC-type xylose transport system permease subunit
MIYLYGAVGAFILLLAGLLWFRGQQLHRVQASNASLTLQLIAAEQANKDQGVTIASQQSALAKWKALADEATDKVAQAVAEVARAQVERDRATAKMLEMDAQDAARRECKAVLDEDIAKACPTVAADMVERAK